MHSSTHGGTTFHFNSDLSGEVVISRDGTELRVPGASLLDFVAEFVRLKRITAVEQASTRGLLGLPNES